MKRDKLGRFVKKFKNSGEITYNDNDIIEINGSKYRIRSGANQAYKEYANYYKSLNNSNNFYDDFETWIKDSDNKHYLEGIYDNTSYDLIDPTRYIGMDKDGIIPSNNYSIKITNSDKLNNKVDEESPAGRTTWNTKSFVEFLGNTFSKPLDKEKLANFLELTKYGTAAAINNKMAERSLEVEKPFLQDISKSYYSVHGGYRAQLEGEQAAA
jgi:hypothetical protein